MSDKSIKANMIVEILGRPPEHIKDALLKLVENLGSEKGVKVLESKVHEPKKVEKSKDLYTTFAEILVEFEDLANYFGVVFTYMPANIEIISPEKYSLSNSELNEFGNRILSRLHDYDAITKKFIYEKNFLVSKIRELDPEFFNKLKASEEKAKAEDKKEEPLKKAGKKKK